MDSRCDIAHAAIVRTQLVEARDSSGLPTTSRDYIRLKVTVASELKKLEEMITDLSEQQKKEMVKYGKKMDPNELEARRDELGSIGIEFREAYKRAKGFAHAESDEASQGAVGINVMSRQALEKGTFSGAGLRTKREELTGEQMQTLAEISTQTTEQDKILDEISKGLDDLKDIAEKMNDVRRRRYLRWRHTGGWSMPPVENMAHMALHSLRIPSVRPAGASTSRQDDR